MCDMCKNVRNVRKCAENKQKCAEMCRNMRKCAEMHTKFCARCARIKILSHVRSFEKFVRMHTPHIEFPTLIWII